MASAAQVIANRANAKLSTGPRTEEGKARSSKNNLRLGFRSQSVLLPGDDPAEFEELLDELTTHFQVEGLTEERYIREMADAEWRLRRVRAHQEVILTAKIADLAASRPGTSLIELQVLAFETLHRESSFAQFLTYEAKFERQYERAYQGWMQTREKVSRYQARNFMPHIEAYCRPPVLTDEPDLDQEPTNEATPQPEPTTIARSAPCPCGSGEKYKRCCGRNAPAVFTATAGTNPTALRR